MSSKKMCLGINSKGKMCGNKCTESSDFCRYHQNPDVLQYNRECPCCLSDEGDFYLTPCMHRLHLECAEHLTSFECPLCRTKITNFPKHINDNIEGNKLKFKNDMEEEDRRNILRDELTIQNLPLLQFEALTAIHYLRNEGIGNGHLPDNVQINTYSNNAPPANVVFTTIVSSVIEQMDSTIRNIDGLENIEEDLSDEDNPFDGRLEELSILSRNANFRTV